MAVAGNKFERGLSMFEILITILVVSIGLLGLAGLQFAGLRAANGAQEHTLATLLAQDIEERIRANLASPPNDPADNYAPAGTPLTLATGGSAPSAPDCTSVNCTPTEMRNFDARRWFYMINSGGDAGLDNTIILPNASILIERCTTTITKIKIQWHGANNTDDPCTSPAPTEPNILVATVSP